MTFGQIKVWAWRLIKGEAIPIFKDNRINRAINQHVKRIRLKQTARKDI